MFIQRTLLLIVSLFGHQIQFSNSETAQYAIPASLPPKLIPDFSQWNNLPVQQVALFDIGSTGTRVHLHQFVFEEQKCGGHGRVSVFVPGWSLKTKPGLALIWQQQDLMAKTPNELDKTVKAHLDPLFEFLKDNLNEDQMSHTLLMARATGGVRALREADQTELVKSLRRVFENVSSQRENKRRADYGHQLNSSLSVNILEGNSEGVFSWMAANQLSRRFFGDYESVVLHPKVDNETALVRTSPFWTPGGVDIRLMNGGSRKTRIGLVEMGGASAQVVLEPPEDIKKLLRKSLSTRDMDTEQKSTPEDLLRPHPENNDYLVLNFCQSKYPLAVQCLEGLGRQAALQQFVRYAVKTQHSSLSCSDTESSSCAVKNTTELKVAKTESQQPHISDGHQQVVFVPCLPKDVEMKINLSDDKLVISEDDFDSSSDQTVIVKGSDSQEYPAQKCRQILRNFLSEAAASPGLPFEVPSDYKIYATENFYYFNEYVLRNEIPMITPYDFWANAKKVCRGSSVQDIKELIHPEASEEKSRSACFGLVFLSEFLRTVLKIPSGQNMKAVTSIKELETSFALGSMILELPTLLRLSTKPVRSHEEL